MFSGLLDGWFERIPQILKRVYYRDLKLLTHSLSSRVSMNVQCRKTRSYPWWSILDLMKGPVLCACRSTRLFKMQLNFPDKFRIGFFLPGIRSSYVTFNTVFKNWKLFLLRKFLKQLYIIWHLFITIVHYLRWYN